MTIKKIYACWIYVNDMQTSIQFYQNIGFTIKFQQEDWVEFDLGDTSFALLQHPKEKGDVTPQKTRIMFETDNIEHIYTELQTKKVKLIGAIRHEDYGKLLTFEDPNGHWLEFFENKI